MNYNDASAWAIGCLDRLLMSPLLRLTFVEARKAAIAMSTLTGKEYAPFRRTGNGSIYWQVVKTGNDYSPADQSNKQRSGSI